MSDPEIITVSTTCVFCGKEHLTHVQAAKYRRWKAGEHIQHVFDELNADEREVLISGTCPQCWDDHMRDPDDN